MTAVLLNLVARSMYDPLNTPSMLVAINRLCHVSVGVTVPAPGQVHLEHKSAYAVLLDGPRDGVVTIDSLAAHEQHLGHASAILDLICQAADASQTMLELVAEPFSEPSIEEGMTQQQLVAWYRSRGFIHEISDAGNYVMLRTPKEHR